MRKILVLYCSARKNGNSAKLASAFIKGAVSAGHTVTECFTANKRIGPCLACDYCQRHNGECVQKDDMQAIIRLLQAHDTLVIAAPVYYLGFPGTFKTLLDRTYAESAIGRKIKASVLLTTACKKEDAVTAVMVQYYDALSDYLGWEKLGVISAKGVDAPGDIENHAALNDAFQLGSQL